MQGYMIRDSRTHVALVPRFEVPYFEFPGLKQTSKVGLAKQGTMKDMVMSFS